MPAKKKISKEKKVQISIPFPLSVYEALKNKAESEDRSITGQCLWELRKNLGLAPKQDED